MWSGYEILLFDVDDTLLDFRANERCSLEILFQSIGRPFDDTVYQAYRLINDTLWRQHEAGIITRNEILAQRFAALFEQMGICEDSETVEQIYRSALNNGIQMIDGAYEVCSQLSKEHRLYVVSNGVAQTQLSRLEKSGLRLFFEDLFISEMIGFQKPHPGFFEYVARHIPAFAPAKTLIIGDSLLADIRGGLQAGIAACWLNRSGAELPAEWQPTYCISALYELLDERTYIKEGVL